MFNINIGLLITFFILQLFYIYKKRKTQFEALPTSDQDTGLNMGLSAGQFGNCTLQLPQDNIGKLYKSFVRKRALVIYQSQK